MGPKCPECIAGKHQNCTGETWDNELDDVVMCTCLDGDHPMRDDIYLTD